MTGSLENPFKEFYFEKTRTLQRSEELWEHFYRTLIISFLCMCCNKEGRGNRIISETKSLSQWMRCKAKEELAIEAQRIEKENKYMEWIDILDFFPFG